MQGSGVRDEKLQHENQIHEHRDLSLPWLRDLCSLTLHQLPAAAASRVIQGVGIALATQQESSPCKNYHVFYFIFKLWE